MCPACLLKMGFEGIVSSDTPTVLNPALWSAAESVERPGTEIGRYKLLEAIGEGGFGIVYLAQQNEPVKRHVAIKILKPGMDTREIVARFEAERQALALMDHPNIARVFDGGETATGRPYFVMELVRGVPLTKHCDNCKLTTRQRLELFLDVLAAVQHAHQKGIIHRDLKPSNILVSTHDQKPDVKVIDFGIAKAISLELTDKTLFTATGRMIGTPVYMSPEQTELNALDVDTRSDVYSLGVVLYELLTGRTPIDRKRLRQAGYEEIQRLIREEEPPKPSTRISTLGDDLPAVAHHRGVEPLKLGRQVRGDLDWIVMKALEKERERRYETANAFAADLQRHLNDEAVHASPPSQLYRLRKLVRRRRGLIAASSAVLLALMAGLVASLWQAAAATKARDEARQEAAISKAVADFVELDLFGSANPTKSPDRDLKVRTVLDRASEKIASRLQNQPLVGAQIQSILAHTYGHLGEYEKARMHALGSLETRRKVLGPEDEETLNTRRRAASLLSAQGKLAEADKELRAVVSDMERVLGPESKNTIIGWDSVAGTLWQLGKNAEAESIFRRIIPIHERAFGVSDGDTQMLRNNFGVLLMELRKYPEAAELMKQVLEYRARTFGPEHPDTLMSRMNTTTLSFKQGEITHIEATAQLRETIETLQRVLRDDHSDVILIRNQLPSVLMDTGQFAEAEIEYRRLIEMAQRVLGTEHRTTILTRLNLAGALRVQGMAGAANAEYGAILAILQRVLGDENPYTLDCRSHLAQYALAHGQHKEAEAEFRALFGVKKTVFGIEHEKTLKAQCELGLALQARRRFPEARAEIESALRVAESAYGGNHASTYRCRLHLARMLADEGKFVAAEREMRALIETAQSALGRNHELTLDAQYGLAQILLELGRKDECREVAQQAMEGVRQTLGPSHPDTIKAENLYNFRILPKLEYMRMMAERGDSRQQLNLGVAFAKGEGVDRDWAEAVKWWRKAAEQGNDKAQCNLGLAYATGQGLDPNHTEAEKWLQKSAEQNNAGAQYQLGIWYGRGEGVAQDYAEAYKWVSLAATQGMEGAKQSLETLERTAVLNRLPRARSALRISDRFIRHQTLTVRLRRRRLDIMAGDHGYKSSELVCRYFDNFVVSP